MTDEALQESKDRVTLAVHVQPGAGTSAVVGRHGHAVKLRIAAPPTGGRANEAVCTLVAREFGLTPSSVEVVSGGTSRQKRVVLGDLDLETADTLLETVLARASKRP